VLANNSVAVLPESLETTRTALLDEGTCVAIEHFIFEAFHALFHPLVSAVASLTEATKKRLAIKNLLKARSVGDLHGLARKSLETELENQTDLAEKLVAKCDSFLEVLESRRSVQDCHTNLKAIFALFVATFPDSA
jgi:hypothetical protein